MSKKGSSLWDSISVADLEKCYLMILEKYEELDNSEWLKYMLIKEKCNRAWWLKVDSKLKHKDTLPSLLFIWYAYEYLNSNKSTVISIVNEVLYSTLEGKKKKKALKINYERSRRLNETDEQRKNRLTKAREYQKNIKKNETPEQKKKRLTNLKKYREDRQRNETADERQKRLARNRKYQRKRLAKETSEQREKRLATARKYRENQRRKNKN